MKYNLMYKQKIVYTVLILLLVTLFDDKVFAPVEKARNTNQQVSLINTEQEFLHKVIKVVDGDTIKIDINGKVETVRMIGVDTPEVVDPRKPVQCFGREASARTKEWLTGREVNIEVDPTQGERDKYGRLLLYIYRDDGLFVNKELIAQGYAHEYTYDTPYKYQKEFKEVGKSAREAGKGLWAPEVCAEQ